MQQLEAEGVHIECISFSPFYRNDNAVRETTWENMSQSTSSKGTCLKLQPRVLLIAVQTFVDISGRCFSFIRFCGRAAVVCVLAAGDGSVSEQRRLCLPVSAHDFLSSHALLGQPF